MRQIVYNRALFILHKKTSNPHIFTTSQKQKYLIYAQKKIVPGVENLELLDHCSF